MKIKRLSLLLIIGLFLLKSFCSAYQIPSSCIVIYGDTQNEKIHQKIVNLIIETKPLAVFHVGDLVNDGLDPERWSAFNEIVSELVQTTPFYPAIGNHDKDSQLFFDNFVLPNNEQWYSVEINNIHFIVLDSNADITKGSKQYEWLKDNLQNIGEEIKFVIAVFHHPPFTTGKHEEEERFKEFAVPLFEQYGVDIVFNGHNHAYERLIYNEIYYIVTGGGGGPFYDQTRVSPYSKIFKKVHHFCKLNIADDRIIVSAIDIGNNLIDQFEIIPKRDNIEDLRKFP